MKTFFQVFQLSDRPKPLVTRAKDVAEAEVGFGFGHESDWGEDGGVCNFSSARSWVLSSGFQK